MAGTQAKKQESALLETAVRMFKLRQIFEIPWLVLVNWANHFWNFWLWLQEIRRYYTLGPLMKADLLWMIEYGLQSPFSLSRQATETQQLPEDLTVYGETPWTSLDRICQEVGLCSEDVFVELGAGTGRNLLFIHYWFGARAIGYELVPRFVEKFNWLKHHLHLDKIVDLHLKNWFEAELSGNIFFLVGTCYSDFHLKKAEEKLADLQAGTRIITVSYPLDENLFEPLKSFQTAFSWGQGTVYIQRKR